MKNKNKNKTKISIKVKSPKIRNDWGNVKPFTRVEPDKTKYDRKKYNKAGLEQYETERNEK